MTDKLNLAATLVLALAPACAMAQAFPAKPLRLVVASSPGSGVDILARLVAPKLAEALGQQVLIDNRAGAGGNLGAAFAARAAPDGYTAFMATPAHAISGSAPVNKTGYDFVRDFAPVSLLTTGHYMLVVHPSVPAHNVKELIALARARTGQLNYASAGNGNATHLAGELFNLMTGVKTVHVPYKGGGPLASAIVAGEAQWAISPAAALMGHVRSGRMRAVAISSAARSSVLPELPTIDEAGLPGYVFGSWNGVFAPRGTPRPVINTLFGAIQKALEDPDVRKLYAAQGLAPATNKSPADFDKYFRSDYERVVRIVKAAGIKPE